MSLFSLSQHNPSHRKSVCSLRRSSCPLPHFLARSGTTSLVHAAIFSDCLLSNLSSCFHLFIGQYLSMSQNSQGVLFKTLLHLSPSNKKIKSYQSNLPFCLLRIHLLPCFLFSFFTGCCSEAVKAHYHLGFFHEILPLFGFCSLLCSWTLLSIHFICLNVSSSEMPSLTIFF